jgi:hypothetical protein
MPFASLNQKVPHEQATPSTGASRIKEISVISFFVRSRRWAGLPQFGDGKGQCDARPVAICNHSSRNWTPVAKWLRRGVIERISDRVSSSRFRQTNMPAKVWRLISVVTVGAVRRSGLGLCARGLSSQSRRVVLGFVGARRFADCLVGIQAPRNPVRWTARRSTEAHLPHPLEVDAYRVSSCGIRPHSKFVACIALHCKALAVFASKATNAPTRRVGSV